MSKAVYKAALFYVEQTVTLHIVLFSVWAQLFLQYWIVVHMDLNTLCVLCRVRASEQKRSRTKTCNKETGRFHKLLTLLLNWVHIRCIYGSVVEGPSQISYNILINIIVTGFVPRLWVMTLWKIFAVDTQFKQLRKRSLKKIQASAGFEPVTSAIPVQCSTNWAMKPQLLGAGQF